jgi:hypothetical protein
VRNKKLRLPFCIIPILSIKLAHLVFNIERPLLHKAVSKFARVMIIREIVIAVGEIIGNICAVAV